MKKNWKIVLIIITLKISIYALLIIIFKVKYIYNYHFIIILIIEIFCGCILYKLKNNINIVLDYIIINITFLIIKNLLDNNIINTKITYIMYVLMPISNILGVCVDIVMKKCNRKYLS